MIAIEPRPPSPPSISSSVVRPFLMFDEPGHPDAAVVQIDPDLSFSLTLPESQESSHPKISSNDDDDNELAPPKSKPAKILPSRSCKFDYPQKYAECESTLSIQSSILQSVVSYNSPVFPCCEIKH